MFIALIGILIGIAIGVLTPVSIPLALSRYTAVAVLAIVDSLLGAVRAEIDAEHDTGIFVSGLLLNSVLAIAITYFGDRLGLELYLGVIVVFTLRMFRNVASIRYHVWQQWTERGKRPSRQQRTDDRPTTL